MFKKFVSWFIIFGLSFLVSDVFGWTEQGKAFFFIHLGADVIFILFLVIVVASAGVATRNFAVAGGVSTLILLLKAFSVGIVLFATWGATKLFNVDFFVAYQIMTFGQCLCVKGDKKDDD